MSTEVKTLPPEQVTLLRNWSTARIHHQRLVAFLEWLEEHQAIALGPQGPECPFKKLDDFKPDRLADTFLEIDRAALTEAQAACEALYAADEE
jgi:hypothetical protein